KRRAVLASLCTGFISGLTWYFLGGWNPELFYLNIHPVWVGSSVNILTIIFVTLFEKQSDWQLKKPDGLTIISAFIGILITFLNIFMIIFVTFFDKQSDLQLKNLYGLSIIISFIGIFITFLNIVYFHVFYANGLFGLFLFATILCFFVVNIRVVKPKKEEANII